MNPQMGADGRGAAQPRPKSSGAQADVLQGRQGSKGFAEARTSGYLVAFGVLLFQSVLRVVMTYVELHARRAFSCLRNASNPPDLRHEQILCSWKRGSKQIVNGQMLLLIFRKDPINC